MINTLLIPISALLNALALLTLTTIGIPFSLPTVIGVNLVFWIVFLISFKPYLKSKSLIFTPRSKLNPISKLSLIIIALSSVYAISHSLLPTFHYDSTTNWNIRSKVSYHRAELVFEGGNGLLEKPQYPVLYHALQLSAMQLVPNWNDSVANGVQLLLSASLMLAVYQLLRERGFNTAITTFSLLLGLPLLAIHTGGGYADLPLVGYATVSLLLFARYMDTRHASDLLLSGVMVAACVWTKSEGLFFCFVPWLTMVATDAWQTRKRPPLYPLLWSTIVSLLWPAYVLLHGYALTPHGSNDAALGFDLGALHAMRTALFSSNSFGVFWYALFGAILLAVVHRKRLVTTYSPTLVWGLLSLVGYLGVYLLTSNAQYLILGQSFDRQLLLPAALLTVSFSLFLTKNDDVVLR